jgi:hypothetical protein
VVYRSLLAGTRSLDDRKSAERPFGNRAPDHSPDTPASLIVTLLLSLGLWAGMWGAITALASVALR